MKPFYIHIFIQLITYDSPRSGVSVLTKKAETTTSFLLIQNARPNDSGQYECNPSNAKSKNVTVHVLNGKYNFYFIFNIIYIYIYEKKIIFIIYNKSL